MIDLEKLKAQDLPRIDADEFLALKVKDGDEPTEEEKEQIERVRSAAKAYFKQFTLGEKLENKNPMTGSVKCVGCGTTLDGFLGSFEYKIAHGEGACRNCGYPARTHHYIKDEDGEDVLTIRNYMLQYHPAELKRREE